MRRLVSSLPKLARRQISSAAREIKKRGAFTDTIQADCTTPILAAGILAAGAGTWWCLRTARPNISLELLKKQDADTHAAIINSFRRNDVFLKYAAKVTAAIEGLDRDYGELLQKGIELAVAKQILPAEPNVEKVHVIKVDSKDPLVVANEIIAGLGDAPSKGGCVITVQGKSASGKETTAAKLAKLIPKAQVFKEMDVFGALALLADTYSKQHGCELRDALTPELLASYIGMLEFSEFNGKYDIRIDGLGLRHFVSEIRSTKLQGVKRLTPEIVLFSEGEVIKFAQGALAKLTSAGMNVLVSGREQTLIYFRTPYRFELAFGDPNLIGMRRAAHNMAHRAQDLLKDKPDANEAAVHAALQEALANRYVSVLKM